VKVLRFRHLVSCCLLTVAALAPGVVSAKGREPEGAPKDGASKENTSKDGASKDNSSKEEAPTKSLVAPRADGDKPLTRSEVKRLLKGNQHLEIRARDLSLTQPSLDRLMRIAKRYFDASHKVLVVTGGTRNSLRQAQLMCSKLDHHEDVIALYENKKLAREVVDAYQKGISEHLGRQRVVRAVRAVIDEQIARGEYISRHMKSGAADVRSRGMSVEQQVSFRKAVAGEAGASLLDERDGAAPHFHINL
jgi:hypothetical protein